LLFGGDAEVSGLDVAAIAIIDLMIAIGIALFVFLGSWPGRVAARLEVHEWLHASWIFCPCAGRVRSKLLAALVERRGAAHWDGLRDLDRHRCGGHGALRDDPVWRAA
jgi:hypothetical protein